MQTKKLVSHSYELQFFNVAKCNLGKVKLEANAVSGLLLKRT